MRPSYCGLSTRMTVRHFLCPQLKPKHRNVPRLHTMTGAHASYHQRAQPHHHSPRGEREPSYKNSNVTYFSSPRVNLPRNFLEKSAQIQGTPQGQGSGKTHAAGRADSGWGHSAGRGTGKAAGLWNQRRGRVCGAPADPKDFAASAAATGGTRARSTPGAHHTAGSRSATGWLR